MNHKSYEFGVMDELQKIAQDGYGYDQMQAQPQQSNTGRNVALGALGVAALGAGALAHKGFGQAVKKVGTMIKGKVGQVEQAGAAAAKPSSVMSGSFSQAPAAAANKSGAAMNMAPKQTSYNSQYNDFGTQAGKKPNMPTPSKNPNTSTSQPASQVVRPGAQPWANVR